MAGTKDFMAVRKVWVRSIIGETIAELRAEMLGLVEDMNWEGKYETRPDRMSTAPIIPASSAV